jgi:hypothetical protein
MYSIEQAQKEYERLIETQRMSSLWFIRSEISTDILEPHAIMILDKIIEKSPRHIWIKAKKLKQWRLQNIK